LSNRPVVGVLDITSGGAGFIRTKEGSYLPRDVTNGAVRRSGVGGTTILSGANTFTGNVHLNTGTLHFNHASAAGTGTLIIDDGTTIDNSSGGAITLSTNNPQTWNGNFTFTGSNNLTVGTGAVAMGAVNVQATVSAATLTLGGIISGTGVLSKAGNGTLTLTGSNTYSGGTAVTGGILSVAADANLGAAPGVATPGSLTLNGGTLRCTGSSAITLNANRGIALGNAGGTINIAITPVAFANASDQGVHYSGIMADVGGQTGALTVSGIGMLMLYNSSTYSGTTTIDTGWISAPSSGGATNNILPTTTT
jgi:autotransporter-associated beta strand protein